MKNKFKGNKKITKEDVLNSIQVNLANNRNLSNEFVKGVFVKFKREIEKEIPNEKTR